SALGTTPVTAEPGFPTRAELVARYVERSGRDVEPLGWFEALALWKAAVFCEAIYGRFIRGELGAEDTRAAHFEEGVPLLARPALEAISQPRRRSRVGSRGPGPRRAATSPHSRATPPAGRGSARPARRARPRRRTRPAPSRSPRPDGRPGTAPGSRAPRLRS